MHNCALQNKNWMLCLRRKNEKEKKKYGKGKAKGEEKEAPGYVEGREKKGGGGKKNQGERIFFFS